MKKSKICESNFQKIFNRVSFRKTSVGLVAVLIGSTFFIVNGQVVKADKSNTSPQSEVVEQVKRDSQSSIADQKTSQIFKQTLNETSIDQKVENDDAQTKQINAESTNNSFTNKNIKVTTNISDKTQSVMAGQDNIKVTVSINNLQPSDKELNLQFTNVGTDKDFQINAGNLDNSNFTKLNDNWAYKANTDGLISVKWINETQNPNNLSIIIPFLGNASQISNSTPAEIELFINGKKYNNPVISTTLTPYVDKVTSNEIIKGFFMGEKSPADEAEYGDLPSTDIDKYSIIYQWGFYFNYRAGNGTSPIVNLLRLLSDNNEQNLNPLEHAKFEISLYGNQILIPSSIRVYRVPAGMAVKNNDVRIGINDKVPGQNYTYYHLITQSQNENKNFEAFLKNHLTPKNSSTPTGFSVDQSDSTNHAGYFYITDKDGKPDYTVATESFFIQLDGGIPKDSTQSSQGPISVSWAEGTGTGDTTTGSATIPSQISGSGNGVDKTKPNPEEPEDPQKPQIPDNPTEPKTPSKPDNPKITNNKLPDLIIKSDKNKKNSIKRSSNRIVKLGNKNVSIIKTSKDIAIKKVAKSSLLPETGEKSENNILLGLMSLMLGLGSFIIGKRRKN